MVADVGTFTPWFEDLAEANPLEFPGYEDKVKAAKEKTGLHEAVTIGHCKIYGEDAVLGICDARFLMSSMGPVSYTHLDVYKRQGEITHFDASGYKCHLAAEVKNFDGKNYMDPKAAKRMELFCQYAVAATKEAIADAGLEMEKEDPYLVGTAIGSGVGSLQAIEREYKKLLEKGPGRVNPLLVPMMISNMAAGNVSIQFGFKGKSINDVTACATGTNTIGEAFRSIQYGEADIMIAGGTEGSICPIGIAGFTALTALSSESDPKRCSLPFDKERSGFVMGEGAGIVVLEELEHAKQRGAKIYAEAVSYTHLDVYKRQCVVNPEVIVIGGGVSKAGDILTDAVKKHFVATSFHACANTKFVLAGLGNDAGMYGCVEMLLD